MDQPNNPSSTRQCGSPSWMVPYVSCVRGAGTWDWFSAVTTNVSGRYDKNFPLLLGELSPMQVVDTEPGTDNSSHPEEATQPCKCHAPACAHALIASRWDVWWCITKIGLPACRTATIALYPLPKAVLSNSGHLRSGGWAGDEDSIMGTERRDDVAGEHYYGQI